MTIGYFEAWAQWLYGQQVNPDARLWLVPIRWWGRAGKIAAFFGAITAILDLVGPERLRELGRAEARSGWFGGLLNKYANVVVLVITGFSTVILVGTIPPGEGDYGIVFAILSALFVATVASLVMRFGPHLVVRLLDTDRPAHSIRWIAVILLVVGFHFDLLAS